MPETHVPVPTKDSRSFHRTPLLHYILHSRILVVLTTPLIYVCAVAFVLLDALISLYQSVCFPVYGIPVVARKKHFLYDRGRLPYLNAIEKVHCIYCSYANGVLSYSAEIAARTEQHWCPIRHQTSPQNRYSRERHFLAYGDAEQYRSRVETVRRDFKDLDSH
jgi:hypothetical protein